MKIRNVDKLKSILAQFETSSALTIEEFAKERRYTVGYADWKLSEVRRALKQGVISANTTELFEKVMNTSKLEAKKLAKLKASIPAPVAPVSAEDENENIGIDVIEEVAA